MKQHNATRRFHALVAGLALTLACGVFGAAVGLLGGRLLSTPTGMGWDTLADTLGGMMVGGVLGLGAGLYLAIGLSVRARWWSAIVAVALGFGVLYALALTAPQRQAQQSPNAERRATPDPGRPTTAVPGNPRG